MTIKSLPTMELSFGGIRWMCQVADDMVVFSEQSGFHGRTKQVRFTPHIGGIRQLCVEVQLQEGSNLLPPFDTVAEMHEIARLLLGMDRFCPGCWRDVGGKDCERCIETRKIRISACTDTGHKPMERTDGALFCGTCGEPMNERARLWDLLPSWLQRIGDVDFTRIQAYRKERWGLEHR